tara:strand:- start:6454 stop:6615 length:162 start_codon:yes stop_codon:yes gene_type:complete
MLLTEQKEQGNLRLHTDAPQGARKIKREGVLKSQVERSETQPYERAESARQGI